MRLKGKELGALGERLAAMYLAKNSYKYLANNWRCNAGEIDLIFLDGDTLVFVEVKTRYSSVIAEKHLFDNITQSKQRKLQKLVEIFCTFSYDAKVQKVDSLQTRIDVIGVLINSDNKLESIKHIKAAVSDERP